MKLIITDEAVEAAARKAMQRDFIRVSRRRLIDGGDPRIMAMVRSAREALEAALPHLRLPEGWRLAPMEPTSEMLDAGWLKSRLGELAEMGPVYRAMLAAAPEPREEIK